MQNSMYDFSDWRNFTEFSRIAYDLGMYTLIRVGPYICAEWENGGLPWWLLKKNISMMRTSEQRFKEEVAKWFSVLLPIVKPMLRQNNGPVLMVQVENEYGSYQACDRWCFSAGFLIKLWIVRLWSHMAKFI
ncbi:glycosyl hydrolase family 35 [Ancylostoma caninum]|uniref:Glycosyl hydrolase family 35 n=1 Tax=Ancylostoma caninum TaxID=29170 RepID=A0A368GHJ7_ANCCA|nr:glycosyl hydrolase family 35 [Ancylostoma caninum]